MKYNSKEKTIVAMTMNHKSPAAIRDATGLPLETINRVIEEWWYDKDPISERDEYLMDRDRAIYKAYEDGHSLTDMAQRTGLPRSTIYHIVDKIGGITHKRMVREVLNPVQKVAIEIICDAHRINYDDLFHKGFGGADVVPIEKLTLLEGMVLVRAGNEMGRAAVKETKVCSKVIRRNG